MPELPLLDHTSAKPPRLKRCYQIAAFLLAYLIFGAFGVATSLSSFIFAFIFKSSRAQRAGQMQIHLLFRFFVWFLQFTGLLKLDVDLTRLRGCSNVILVANHLSLLDVVFIAAHLPNIFCLMKSKILHNIFLCGQAKLAGYVNNKTGANLVKSCQTRLRSGSALLVFPEGTRSRGNLRAFKLGFALVARKAHAPVQTLLVRYSDNFLGKGWPFFKPPAFPLHVSIRLGKRFYPESHDDAQAFGQQVEEYFKEILQQGFSPL